MMDVSRVVREVPWVEKYRPRSIDDVVSQEDIVNALRQAKKKQNLPHLLFYGPPGTGKTSTILAVARDLYGHEHISSRVMELNASDERGIQVVRGKIKKFAQLAVASSSSLPPFKIIILDEADNMTSDAQAALRRTMETYSRVTRFCLICNYVSRIIDPIVSRCAKFRFKPLPPDTCVHRLRYIAEKENVPVDEPMLRSLRDIAEGDLRRAITLLQSAYQMFGDEISEESFIEISGRVPLEPLNSFLESCFSGNFDTMQEEVTNLIRGGYSARQVVSQLHDLLLIRGELDDVQKAKIAIRLSEREKALIEGADEFLQLLDLGAYVMKTANTKI